MTFGILGTCPTTVCIFTPLELPEWVARGLNAEGFPGVAPLLEQRQTQKTLAEYGLPSSRSYATFAYCTRTVSFCRDLPEHPHREPRDLSFPRNLCYLPTPKKCTSRLFSSPNSTEPTEVTDGSSVQDPARLLVPGESSWPSASTCSPGRTSETFSNQK